MRFIEFSYVDYSNDDTPKEKRQKEHNSGIDLCKKMLKKYFNIESPVFLMSEYGKPYIDGKVFFSISHSQNRVVCAVSDKEIGIDIEKVTDIDTSFIQKVSKRFFSENEMDFIEKNDLSKKSFFHVWTRKEAYSKMIGTPLMKNIKCDTLSLDIETFEDNGYIISVCEE